MNKKLAAILTGVALTGSVAFAGAEKGCLFDEASVDTPSGKICFESAKDYESQKKELLGELFAEKEDGVYDWDINHRELVLGFMAKELEKKGGIVIEAPVTKEKIRDSLLKLIQ